MFIYACVYVYVLFLCIFLNCQFLDASHILVSCLNFLIYENKTAQILLAIISHISQLHTHSKMQNIHQYCIVVFFILKKYQTTVKCLSA